MLLLLTWRAIPVLGLGTGSNWVHSNWTAIFHPKHNVHPIFLLWVNTMPKLNLALLDCYISSTVWGTYKRLYCWTFIHESIRPSWRCYNEYNEKSWRGFPGNGAFNKCQGHYCKCSEAYFFCATFHRMQILKRLHISYFMAGKSNFFWK